MSLTTMLRNRNTSEAGELINSSDIPDTTKTATIGIAAIRQSPEGWDAPAIIDFEKPVFGKRSWAVNRTNMKALIKFYGDDETKLVGRRIKLEVKEMRNPRTNAFVLSLVVVKP